MAEPSPAVFRGHYMNLYLSSTLSARPRGSATRGSQPAPTTSSTLCAVNGGSVSSRFWMPSVIVTLVKPVYETDKSYLLYAFTFDLKPGGGTVLPPSGSWSL